MNKAHASDDEVLLLVRLKREQAKRAINEIIDHLAGNSTNMSPGIALLDYLLNMIYAIELLLKLLASEWQSHEVDKMYEKAFGKPHVNPKLMDAIEKAIVDQKYILEPSSDLIEQIPEMEGLFESLQEPIRKPKAAFPYRPGYRSARKVH